MDSSLFTLSAAYVNQSLKGWTRSTSYMRPSFVDQLRGRCLNAKSLLGFDWTCTTGVHQKRVNVKSAVIMADAMSSCSTSIFAAKKHIADLALVTPRFSYAFLQENFTIKWWISSWVEARNFNKNSTKIDFLFAGLNMNLIIRKKRQKNGRFMDDNIKTTGIKYLNIETWLLLAPYIISGYAPAWVQWFWGTIALGKSLTWVRRNFLNMQVWWGIYELSE